MPSFILEDCVHILWLLLLLFKQSYNSDKFLFTSELCDPIHTRASTTISLLEAISLWQFETVYNHRSCTWYKVKFHLLVYFFKILSDFVSCLSHFSMSFNCQKMTMFFCRVLELENLIVLFVLTSTLMHLSEMNVQEFASIIANSWSYNRGGAWVYLLIFYGIINATE